MVNYYQFDFEASRIFNQAMVSRHGLTELYTPPKGTKVNAQYVLQTEPDLTPVGSSGLSLQQYRFRSRSFWSPPKDMELKKSATKLFESIKRSK